MITDQRLAVANIHALLSPASLSKLMAGVAIAVTLYFGLVRFRNRLELRSATTTKAATVAEIKVAAIP